MWASFRAGLPARRNSPNRCRPNSGEDLPAPKASFPVEFVLNQRHRGQKVSIISDTALAFGRSMFHRYDIDWEHYGFDEAGLDELNEFSLRVLHSFLSDPGRPPRNGADLRRYLTRWIGPAIAYPQMVRAMDALGAPEQPRARRRTSKAS